MELKDYYATYGKEIVTKVLAKLEKEKKHVNTIELKKMLEYEERNRK